MQTKHLAELAAKVFSGNQPISFWFYLFALGVAIGAVAGLIDGLIGMTL